MRERCRASLCFLPVSHSLPSLTHPFASSTLAQLHPDLDGVEGVADEGLCRSADTACEEVGRDWGLVLASATAARCFRHGCWWGGCRGRFFTWNARMAGLRGRVFLCRLSLSFSVCAEGGDQLG